MDGQAHEWTHGLADGGTDGCTDKLMDRQTDGLVDGGTDDCTDK